MSAPQPNSTAEACPPTVDELQQRQSVVVGERQHGSQRCLEPLRVEAVSRRGAAGRNADQPRECVAKAASGFEALVELKIASGMTNPGRLKDLGDVQLKREVE